MQPTPDPADVTTHLELDLLCRDRLHPEARAFLADVRERFTAAGILALEARLAALPRRLGRAATPGGTERVGPGLVCLPAWRACDLGAAWLITSTLAGTDDRLVDLYFKGDAEERRMILRSLAFLAPGEAMRRLQLEAHRTNDEVLFAAAHADSDVAARTLPIDDLRRVVLKAAFLDLPIRRLIGVQARVDTTLAAMLLEFMSEREAAGRPVWADSLGVAAAAPTAAVLAKLAADLDHADPARRLAAVLAIRGLARRPAELAAALAARRQVETDGAVLLGFDDA